MDKRIILAVAGSGKTSYIVDRLKLEDRSLILTYTENNFNNLRHKIINKFGFLSEKLRLYTYFQFLYTFCYKPLLLYDFPSKGICYDFPPPRRRLTDNLYYINSSYRLYHNRIAKLLEIKNVQPLLDRRIEKYFDNIFVDEVQDFAGHDFNLLINICKLNINVILVGDYFQHTFDTSRDGSVNKNLHSNLENYKARFLDAGVDVDSETLSHSYRCSPELCTFIREKIGVSIYSHRSDKTQILLIEDEATIEEKIKCSKTIKLFYKDHKKYLCYSQNWGASKGEDRYNDVCVILNQKSYKLFIKQQLNSLPSQTKNKLYVACTRARGDLRAISF